MAVVFHHDIVDCRVVKDTKIYRTSTEKFYSIRHIPQIASLDYY